MPKKNGMPKKSLICLMQMPKNREGDALAGVCKAAGGVSAPAAMGGGGWAPGPPAALLHPTPARAPAGCPPFRVPLVSILYCLTILFRCLIASRAILT